MRINRQFLTSQVFRWFSPVIASLLAGGILILAVGHDPLQVYANLLDSGFSCRSGEGRCALLTALQFATPLIFSGLSATVALRAGFFSIGQAGQMLFGAAAATWAGAHLALPAGIHPLVCLAASAFAGAFWGWTAALLREYLGVNEIIGTLILNSIASVLVGMVWLPRIAPTAYLHPLVGGSKVTASIFFAVAAVIMVYLFLWKTPWGYEMRMAAQAPRFAKAGGIVSHRPVLLALALSGALAGLAGAVEVLGVQYRFISSFTSISDFDGLIVAFAGHLHPAGVALFAFLLGGLRTGSITGLQIQSGIPRELGGALIALMLLFVATNRPFRKNGALFPKKRPATSDSTLED